jgi:hypothetical protein
MSQSRVQYDDKERFPLNHSGEESSRISGKEIGQPAPRPPPIHVPIPPMDADDSSMNSEEKSGDEHEDTYGDVSSISGGDF